MYDAFFKLFKLQILKTTRNQFLRNKRFLSMHLIKNLNVASSYFVFEWYVTIPLLHNYRGCYFRKFIEDAILESLNYTWKLGLRLRYLFKPSSKVRELFSFYLKYARGSYMPSLISIYIFPFTNPHTCMSPSNWGSKRMIVNK